MYAVYYDYCFIGIKKRMKPGMVTNTSSRLTAVIIRLATSFGSNIDMLRGLQPSNIPVFMKYGQISVT